MKKQLKTKNKINFEKPDHRQFKIAQTTIGAITLLSWIVWFICDCIFVTKGAKILDSLISQELIWNQTWFEAGKITAAITLSFLGVFMCMEVAYLVIIGRQARYDIKNYVYELIVHAACVIGIMICIIVPAEMMVNNKFVLELSGWQPIDNPILKPILEEIFGISKLPTAFDLYHLNFLKYLSVGFVLVTFGMTTLLMSFRHFSIKAMVKDINVLIIVFAALIVCFYPGAIYLSMCRNDVYDVTELFGKPMFVDVYGFWNHITGQCITMPMGVLAGTVMVLMFIRLIIFFFLSKEEFNKTHLIIYVVITLWVTAVFIICHVNALEIMKILNNEALTPTIIFMTLQTASCIAAGIYTSLSMKRLMKQNI